MTLRHTSTTGTHHHILANYSTDEQIHMFYYWLAEKPSSPLHKYYIRSDRFRPSFFPYKEYIGFLLNLQ